MIRRFVCVTVLVPCLLAASTLVAQPASSAVVPQGFADTLVAGGLGNPTAVAQLPDGRFLVTSQSGQLRVVQGASTTTALDLAALSKVCTNAEEGLLGVAVDPQFSINGHIYLFYTAAVGSCALNGANPGGAKNRVARFTLSGSTVNASTEVILLDNMPEWGGNHNGGDVHVANDGTLFVAVGDGGGGRPDSNPADLSLPNGKILRINLDGTIPADNPHGSTSCRTSWGPPASPKVCGEVWADGLRNPFRLGFDRSAPTPTFRINDVGQNTWEEVDAGIAGAHYGWPCREGPAAAPSSAPCNTPTTDPLLFYNHSTGCNVITGGAFVPSNGWAGYQGAYLFVDFGCGRLFAAQPGQTGTPPTTLATGMAQTTDLEFFVAGGNNSLFYTTYAAGGQLRKITGPSSVNPIGTLESATATSAAITVGGWALDPRTPNPIDVRVSVNGLYVGATRAGDPRPDVAAVYPLAGPGHGFTTTVPAAAGSNQVCVDAVPVGPSSNITIGCQTVNVSVALAAPPAPATQPALAAPPTPATPPALIAGSGLWLLPTAPAPTQSTPPSPAGEPRPRVTPALATADAWVYRLPLHHRSSRAARR